jgi:hypothetical protein
VGSKVRQRPVRFVLPAPRWRLAAPPPRPLAASPTSVPLSLTGLDLGTAAPPCAAQALASRRLLSGHHGLPPAVLGRCAKCWCRCSAEAPLWCCVWPISLMQGAVADWICPLQICLRSSLDAGCAPLRVGGCSALVRPDLGQALLVLVLGRVVVGAGLRIRRRSFTRLAVWWHVLRVAFHCWLRAARSEVGLAGD